MNTAAPDFQEILWYAERAKAAYAAEGEIRDSHPNTTRVATLPEADVQYFLEVFPDQRLQVLAIRGTSNLANAKEDLEYIQSRNTKLGIYVHRGFEADADALYADVLPHLDRNLKVRVTGHSLGAAISTLLMMFLHKDGYVVERSVNFGQPKLTNARGAEAYGFLNLLRIVDENDLVPLVPPLTLIDSLHGAYEHLGSELILLRDQYFAVLEQSDAARRSVLSFWTNLGHESIEEHYMDSYLRNIRSKLAHAEQVPYEMRERYV